MATDIGTLRAKFEADTTNFDRGMKHVESGMKQVEKSASSLTSMLAGAAGGLASLVGVSAVSSIRSAASAWFEYSSSLEQSTIAFTTMLGSAQLATAHLQALRQFALTTPFEFPDLVRGSQRMHALGFATEQVIPLLNDVGNAVAAVGGGAETLDRVVLALGQMQSKGKVATQELNQLTESNIPAWRIMEEQMGKSRAELVKLVEAGEVSSATFLEMFQTFSRNKFGDLMAQQSKTAVGALSNIKDAVFDLADRALKPLFEGIRKNLLALSDQLARNQNSWVSWGNQATSRFVAIINSIQVTIDKMIELDNLIARTSGLQGWADRMGQRTQEEYDKYLTGTMITLGSLGISSGLTPRNPVTGDPASALKAGQLRPGEGPSPNWKPPTTKGTGLLGGGGGGGGGGRVRIAKEDTSVADQVKVLTDLTNDMERAFQDATDAIVELGVKGQIAMWKLADPSKDFAATLNEITGKGTAGGEGPYTKGGVPLLKSMMAEGGFDAAGRWQEPDRFAFGKGELKKSTNAVNEWADDIANIFGNLFDSIGNGWKGMLNSLIRDLQSIGSRIISNQIFRILSQIGMNNDFVGTKAAGIGDTPVLGKAAGGPVSSGTPYIVGERGPELFVPQASGNIIPNGGGQMRIAIFDDRRRMADFRPDVILKAQKQMRKIGKLAPI